MNVVDTSMLCGYFHLKCQYEEHGLFQTWKVVVYHGTRKFEIKFEILARMATLVALPNLTSCVPT